MSNISMDSFLVWLDNADIPYISGLHMCGEFVYIQPPIHMCQKLSITPLYANARSLARCRNANQMPHPPSNPCDEMPSIHPSNADSTNPNAQINKYVCK